MIHKECDPCILSIAAESFKVMHVVIVCELTIYRKPISLNRSATIIFYGRTNLS
jgi:hypothetical protein